MDAAINKNSLLDRIKFERGFWETLLEEVGEARMTQPGATGHWTFKDVIAHLNAWRQQGINKLTAAKQHQLPAAPAWPAFLDEETETEQINEWIFETNRHRSLQDILSESRRQFDQLEELTQSLSEQDLLDPNRFAWMQGNPLGPTILTFSHLHEEHEPMLRAWLDKLANKQMQDEQA
ncbi:MAG: ClbS/DfsB family four-helix bundle protein [Chloroflexi bacterium]|nr:ClbS/DfsB family four-helix bundle protein [Chloroflexota bacterium]